MVGIIAFHVLMLALGIVIATRLVSLQAVGNLLGYLHKSIGITTPATEQVRTVALIWIGSVIVMVDGCLFLLLFITRMSS
jgi:predicted 2-oxoglutarate/Fe(II)-dependent dioxygenase YbiX